MIIIERIMEQISGFPKNLSYNLKKLQGSLIKQRIRVQSDKTSYNANERIMFNFPIGRMIDSRSVVMFAKCTTNTNGNYFPRGGLNSLIESLQITANGKVLQSTQYYNYIWNTLADLSGYFSQEQASKRIYENFDPSLVHTNTQGEGAPTIANKVVVTNATESLYLAVTNWLGFLSSSCSCWNTNDMGQIQMICTLAPNGCLWVGNNAGTSAAAGTYKVEEVTLTMDCVTFTNSLYYDLVEQQLKGNGLNIAYNDYLVSVGSLVAKSTTGITHNAQFSTNSLDQVIATFRPNAYDTVGNLLLSTGGASSLTYPQTLADPAANEGTVGGFNNSKYYQRDGGGIDYSSWYINSQPMTNASTPVEIFNSSLQALDYAQLDLGIGGIHQGVLSSTGFYNKYYFADILSLENISGDNNNWVSGLGGNGGVIQIQYNARFKTLTDNVYPIIIGKVTKVLNIKIGRNLDLME